MNLLKRLSVLVFTGAILLGIYFGFSKALHSELFIARSVEIVRDHESSEVSENALLELAQVPLDKISLFDLDLNSIQRRLLSHEWVKSVSLYKRLPKTLVVNVSLKEPAALFQKGKGQVAYVDHEGQVFGTIDLVKTRDLPLLSGFDSGDPTLIQEGLRLIAAWEKSKLPQYSSLAAVYWEADRGFRALAKYMDQSTMIDFGIDSASENDSSLDIKLLRLAKVINYLSQNKIAVRQVWVDAGKKVVVKTVRNS